jgi:hypothetical protein
MSNDNEIKIISKKFGTTNVYSINYFTDYDINYVNSKINKVSDLYVIVRNIDVQNRKKIL